MDNFFICYNELKTKWLFVCRAWIYRKFFIFWKLLNQGHSGTSLGQWFGYLQTLFQTNKKVTDPYLQIRLNIIRSKIFSQVNKKLSQLFLTSPSINNNQPTTNLHCCNCKTVDSSWSIIRRGCNIYWTSVHGILWPVKIIYSRNCQ